MRFSTTDGGLYVDGNITATGTITPSDARLKRNVCPVDDALAFINALRVVTFEKVDPDDVDRPDARYVPGIGVIAQELQPLAPDDVKTLASGYLGVNDHGVFYRLVRGAGAGGPRRCPGVPIMKNPNRAPRPRVVPKRVPNPAAKRVQVPPRPAIGPPRGPTRSGCPCNRG